MESSAFSDLLKYSQKVRHRKPLSVRLRERYQERFKLIPMIVSVVRHPVRGVALYMDQGRNLSKDLCETCAKYDWEYFFRRHLNPSFDGFNIQDHLADSRKWYRRLGFPGTFGRSRDPYTDEIKDKLHNTFYFTLCSLETMMKNKDCAICSLACLRSPYDTL